VEWRELLELQVDWRELLVKLMEWWQLLALQLEWRGLLEKGRALLELVVQWVPQSVRSQVLIMVENLVVDSLVVLDILI
jgi:hypothetical protein